MSVSDVCSAPCSATAAVPEAAAVVCMSETTRTRNTCTYKHTCNYTYTYTYTYAYTHTDIFACIDVCVAAQILQYTWDQ